MINHLLHLLLLNANSILFQSDKVWTVLTVVLIIWLGIVYMLVQTNRKIHKLEKHKRGQRS